MLFADDIVLIDETREGVSDELEQCTVTLEFKGFRLSRSKTEYLKYRFTEGEGGIEDKMMIGGMAIPRFENFRYLSSIIQERGDIDEDINHPIKLEW